MGGCKRIIVWAIVFMCMERQDNVYAHAIEQKTMATVWSDKTLQKRQKKHLDMYNYKNLTKKKVNRFFTHTSEDFVETGKNIFTMDSMKVLTGIMPLYITGRYFDERIHDAFYNETTHTNIHQLPNDFSKFFLKDTYCAIPYVAYGMLGFMRIDDEKRRKAQIFMAGVGWTWGVKYVVKEILSIESNLRPLNGNYSKSRVHGGNPSGHVALASYMTTYLLSVDQLRYGIAMAIVTGLIGSLSVMTNTHYLSQVFAGVGLGVTIGLSSSKVFKAWEKKGIEIGPLAQLDGSIGLGAAYNF